MPSLPLESELTNFWNEGDSGNQDNSQVTDNLAFKQLVVYASDEDKLCAVTEPLPWVEVSEKHEWHVFLETEVVIRESIRIESVKVLSIEPE